VEDVIKVFLRWEKVIAQMLFVRCGPGEIKWKDFVVTGHCPDDTRFLWMCLEWVLSAPDLFLMPRKEASAWRLEAMACEVPFSSSAGGSAIDLTEYGFCLQWGEYRYEGKSACLFLGRKNLALKQCR